MVGKRLPKAAEPKRSEALPVGNHGDNAQSAPGRTRVALDLPLHIVELLDSVVLNLGGTRTSWALDALIQALPGYLDRSADFARRIKVIQGDGK